MQVKQALTTGEIAKFCGVNFRTVIRWIERGHLESYKLPGRGDNRVPVESFIQFLQTNNMPIPEGLLDNQRCLLVYSEGEDCIAELASLGRRTDWDVIIALDPLQFGYLFATRQPRAVIIVGSTWQDSVERLQKELDNAELLLVSVNTMPQPAKKGWHQFAWPEEQNFLTDLLQAE